LNKLRVSSEHTCRSRPIYLSKLSLNGFRNHTETKLELRPGLSVFQGANGQGKSNLLEAAYLLAIAKSPRTSSDRELVNWETAARGGHVQVLGVAREDGDTVQAQVDIDVAPYTPGPFEEAGTQIKKSLRVNGIIRQAVEFVGRVTVVYFEAADLEIVTGGPADKRRFLDILISQTAPEYLKTLQRYSRIILQRNQLLRRVREGTAAREELEFWDERLSAEGAAVVRRRRDVVDAIRQKAVDEHSKLSGGRDSLEMEYLPRLGVAGAAQGHDTLPVLQADVALALRRGLTEAYQREVAAGASLIGPHRDDLALRLNGQPADAFSSRGQARSITLALKLAETEVLAEATGRRPVIALDDILSELDPARRALVLERVATAEQALLTTTEFELVPDAWLRTAAKFVVEGGKVSAATG
jgi:DNA replication and repair protein RecF